MIIPHDAAGKVQYEGDLVVVISSAWCAAQPRWRTAAGVDATACIVGQKFTETLGPQIVIEKSGG